MSFIEFLQLLIRNKKWVVLFPIFTAISIFITTRNSPDTYSSEMVIYTGIASGYNVDNDMQGKIDYHAANSKFDNLINTITSKETRKIVSLRYLASLIHNQKEAQRIVASYKTETFDWIADTTITASVKGINEDETYLKLIVALQKGSENPYYQLLYGERPSPFSLKTLGTIKATRLGFSDMVKVEYTAEDAIVTKTTLDVLAAVFLQKYKSMRVGEVNNVVKYFEEQTTAALVRLQNSEQELKNFRIQNKVINYYEQTKYIADQKQDFDQRESVLQMDLKGYQSALVKIESKLSSKALIRLQSDDVVKLRSDLAARYNARGLELIQSQSSNNIEDPSINHLKNELKSSIESLYEVNNSIEGVPGKNLLDQWLVLTVGAEETNAKLQVLENNKRTFEKVYDQFAPMGSDLTKLERDVEVAEKEYLNLLHNLNQARLRERNLVVTENISVTDPALLPVVANSSKRMLLVIAGFAGALIFVLVLLIVKEYLDDSISNPLRAQQLTGLKVATAFGTLASKVERLAIDNLSYRKWKVAVLELMNKSVTPSELTVFGVPFHKGIKHHHLMERLKLELNESENKWEVIKYGQKSESKSNKLVVLPDPGHELILPMELNNCNLVYLFMDATEKLDEYQLQVLEGWKSLNLNVQIVLINTRDQNLERFIGELPKKRSKIRRKLKATILKYS